MSLLISEGSEKITKAKTHLVLKHPFFSIIALGLTFKNHLEAGVRMPFPTMCTDGRHVFWDEQFVARITLHQLVGVIAHEVLHCVFMHFVRRGNRIPLIWNFACDYAINHIVIEAGFEMPEGYLWEPKYKGWLVDAIYDDLIKNMPPVTEIWVMPGEGEPCEDGDQPGDGKGKGKGGKKVLWGTVIEPVNDDGTEMTDAEKSELVEDIKIKVVQAAEAAKSIGKLPAALEGLIKAVKKPTVNWKEYIQSWVSGKTPDDYTWRKPNRKMLGLFNMVLPSIQLNGSGVGVLSIDTSGSVSDEELTSYVSEIVGVIELCNPDKLYIMQHDATMNRCDVWEAGDPFDDLKVTHRGGTCIMPSFKYALEKIDEEIDWMICFTDMGINDYPRKKEHIPHFPVLWAATGPDNAPFGTYLPLRDAMSAIS